MCSLVATDHGVIPSPAGIRRGWQLGNWDPAVQTPMLGRSGRIELRKMVDKAIPDVFCTMNFYHAQTLSFDVAGTKFPEDLRLTLYPVDIGALNRHGESAQQDDVIKKFIF